MKGEINIMHRGVRIQRDILSGTRVPVAGSGERQIPRGGVAETIMAVRAIRGGGKRSVVIRKERGCQTAAIAILHIPFHKACPASVIIRVEDIASRKGFVAAAKQKRSRKEGRQNYFFHFTDRLFEFL